MDKFKRNIFGDVYNTIDEKEFFEPDYPACALLWSHISNEPGGTVRTCCIASQRIKDNQGRDFNLGEDSMIDILQSDTMKSLRNEIRDGQRPKNCEACWKDEDAGKQSKRQQYNEYYRNWYGRDWQVWMEEPKRIIDAQLIFDNTCNLKCRSCNTNYSSKWREETLDRKIPFWKTTAKVDMMNPTDSKFWKDIHIWTKDLRRLEIMGGEPFYMKQFKEFVDYLIDNDRAKNINLTLSTNGTIADKNFLEKMAKNFKDISFSVSIDGIGERFEYLRHPGNWTSVKQNLDYFHQLHTGDYPVHIQITHTLSALNIMYLPEFYDYFAEHFPKFNIWNNIVNHPKWLNMSVLPRSTKKIITNILKNHDWKHNMSREELDSIMNLLNNDLYQKGSSIPDILKGKFDQQRLDFFDQRRISMKWEIFKQQIVSGDKYRSENFTKVFPELYEALTNEFDYTKEYDSIVEYGYPSISQEEYAN